uniref:SRCR domain-containing protein n=1 Tax=Anas platyrhynchos TaxID=8839 RepID=A0A8B9R500_ANAPL
EAWGQHDSLLTLPVLVFEGTAEVRLVDGGSRCAGRAEVKHRGQWGTVCSDHWDMTDAAVVCRQLGCGVALEAPRSAQFGPGSGSIWMDDVECNGKESALSDCTHNGWDQTDCDHSLDAGVTCSGFVRLVGGDSPCSGSLEVYDRDQWKAVCHSHFGAKAAEVVCRELQCGTALSVHGAAQLGEGAGPVWDRELQCVGNESTILFCPWGTSKDKVVVCSPKIRYTGFRLVNGSTACEGRVEVEVLGTWGTLCASRWDLSDAHVLCRHLGCGFAESIPGGGHFGRGTGPVWRDSFHCDGTEAHLGQCPVTALGASPCSQENAAAVICSGECWALLQSPFAPGCLAEFLLSPGSRRVRLVDGAGRCAGRVEIYYQGRWGTVCDDTWDLADAAVVCHQLGCGGALEAAGSARFGEGSGQIWLDGVNCSGAEAALWDCPAEAWGQHDCGHKEDVGVICSEFMALRLENSDGCSGRLQVFYNGTWGSVCSNSMTTETVSLVCKELGCGNEGELETISNYEKLSGTAWLDRVECGKSNSSFWQCPSDPWHPQSCTDRREETHITCNERPQVAACPNSTSCTEREKIRAVGGKDGCSGRVEIWHRGTWGTLCDNAWDMRDAEVACRQLGCGPALYALGQAAAGEGTGPMWLMDVFCSGNESALSDCTAIGHGETYCSHSLDAGVICSGKREISNSSRGGSLLSLVCHCSCPMSLGKAQWERSPGDQTHPSPRAGAANPGCVPGAERGKILHFPTVLPGSHLSPPFTQALSGRLVPMPGESRAAPQPPAASGKRVQWPRTLGLYPQQTRERQPKQKGCSEGRNTELEQRSRVASDTLFLSRGHPTKAIPWRHGPSRQY